MEESKKQQVEEVEVKMTTKKKKEKMEETSIPNESKVSDVEESTATAIAIKSSTENARTSEIARDLAQVRIYCT